MQVIDCKFHCEGKTAATSQNYRYTRYPRAYHNINITCEKCALN